MDKKTLVNVNVPFTEEEHNKLKTAKGTLSWHDFILTLVEEKNE